MGIFGTKEKTLRKRWQDSEQNASDPMYEEGLGILWDYVGQRDSEGGIGKNLQKLWRTSSDDSKDKLDPLQNRIYSLTKEIRRRLKRLQERYSREDSEAIKDAASAIAKQADKIYSITKRSEAGTIAEMARSIINVCK